MPRDAGQPAAAKPAAAKPAAAKPAAAKPAPAKPTAPKPVEAELVQVEPTPSVRAEPTPINAASGPDAAALEAISASLAGAGRRARNRKAQTVAGRPEPAYSAALRDRLIGGGPAATTAAAAPTAATAADREAATANPGEALGPLGRPRVGGGTATRAATATAGTGAAHRRRRAGIWAVSAALILVVAVAAVGIAGGRFASTPSNRAGDVAGTTLVRGGASSVLSSGTALAAGDEVTVGAGGHATLDLGASLARLDSGADVRLDGLSASTVQLTLVAGRIYSRVSLPAGGTYAVATGPFSWSATGTAFDLDLTPGATGAGQVSLLALEHSVTVSGPNTETEVPEGNLATVGFGGSSPSALAVGPIPTSAFTDPWLITNAQADEQLGDPIGALAGVALAPNGTPTARPSQSVAPGTAPVDSASPSPSDQPSPTVQPSPSPTPTTAPTAHPTPTPTASPSPTPTATPKPSFNLTSTSCPGGVVLSWTKYTGSGFVKYVTLRSSGPDIGATYPQAGTTTVTTASTSNKSISTGYDPIGNTTEYYRTFALGSNDRVLAVSPLRTFNGLPTADLGPLDVSTNYNLLIWQAVQFARGCFSEYVIHFSNPIQQTLKVADASTGNVLISGWSSGQTATFTVVAIRSTPLGDLVVGDASPFSTTHP